MVPEKINKENTIPVKSVVAEIKPTPNPYTKKVYENLLDAFGQDNLPTYEIFSQKISDPKYRYAVRENLLDVYGPSNVPDFKSFNDSLDVVIPEKKNLGATGGVVSPLTESELSSTPSTQILDNGIDKTKNPFSLLDETRNSFDFTKNKQVEDVVTNLGLPKSVTSAYKQLNKNYFDPNPDPSNLQSGPGVYANREQSLADYKANPNDFTKKLNVNVWKDYLLSNHANLNEYWKNIEPSEDKDANQQKYYNEIEDISKIINNIYSGQQRANGVAGNARALVNLQNDVEKASDYIKQYVREPGDQEKALIALGNSSIDIFGDNEELSEYEQKPLGKYLNSYQSIGLNYLRRLDRPKAEFFEKYKDVDPSRYDNFGGYYNKVGYQKQAKQLDELGANIHLNWAQNQLNELDNRYKQQGNYLDPEDVVKYQKILESANKTQEYLNHLADYYPDVIDADSRQIAQDYLGYNSGVWGTAGSKLGYGFANMAQSVYDLAASPFRSKEEIDEAALYAAGFGDYAGAQTMSRSDIRSGKTGQFIPNKELLGKMEAIKNSNLEPVLKAQQISNLIQNNRDKYTFIPPDGGYNWNAKMIFSSTLNFAADLAPFILQAYATRGMGGSSMLGRFTNMFGNVLVTSYEQELASAVNENKPNPEASALANIFVNALAYEAAGVGTKSISYIRNAAGKMGGMADKIISKLDDATIKKMLDNPPRNLKTFMTDLGKASLKTAGEGAQGALAFEAILGGKKYLETGEFNLEESALNALNFTLFHTVAGTGSEMVGLNSINKNNLYQAALDVDNVIFDAKKALAEGKITEQKHNQIIKNVEAASKVLERVPMVDENGKKLKDKDASELLYLKIKEQFIKDKLNKDIPEKLKQKYNKELSDNQQKIDKIYKGSLPQNIGKPFAGLAEGKMGEVPVTEVPVAETAGTVAPVQEVGKAPKTKEESVNKLIKIFVPKIEDPNFEITNWDKNLVNQIKNNPIEFIDNLLDVNKRELEENPQTPNAEFLNNLTKKLEDVKQNYLNAEKAEGKQEVATSEKGVKPTDIEAQKADIERRRQEDLSKLPNKGNIEGDLITVKSNEADAIDAKYDKELKDLESGKAEVKPTEEIPEVTVEGLTEGYKVLGGKKENAVGDIRQEANEARIAGKDTFTKETVKDGKKTFTLVDTTTTDSVGRPAYKSASITLPEGTKLTIEDVMPKLKSELGIKEEVKPSEVIDPVEEQKPVKKENINIKNIVDEKGNINTYSLKAAIVDTPALINVNEKTIENTVGHLRQIADKVNDKELNDTVTYLEDASNMLLSLKNMEEGKRNEFLSNQENFYSDKKPPSEVLKRLDDWAKVLKGNTAKNNAERLLKEQYQQVLGEIQKRFIDEKQQPNRPKLLEAPVEVKPAAEAKKEIVSTQKVKIPGTKESKSIPLSEFTLEKEGEKVFTKRVKKDEGGINGVEPLNQFKLNQGWDANGNPYPKVHIILDEADARKYQEGFMGADGKKKYKNIAFREEINNIAKNNRNKTDEIVLDFRKSETDALDKYNKTEITEEAKIPAEAKVASDLVSVSVAPYYDTQIKDISDASKLRESEGYKEHIQMLKKVAKTMGLEINSIDDTIGGFENEQNNKITEISNRVKLNTKDIDAAEKYAAVVGALAHETQEATIAARYVEHGDPNQTAIETELKVSDLNNAVKSLKEAGINSFEINENDNSIKILDFDNGKSKDFNNKMLSFADILDKNNVKYETEHHAIESRYVDPKRRAELLKEAKLQAEQQKGGPELRDIYEKSKAKSEEFLSKKELPVEIPEEVHNPIVDKIRKGIQKLSNKAKISVLKGKNFTKALNEAIKTGGANLQSWGGFEKKGFEESPEWQKLIDDGTVKLNFDLKGLEGKAVVIINPDNMLTGEVITKDGKKVIDGNGGINFVTKFGDVWASSDKDTASQLAGYINEARKKDLAAGGDGTVHIIVSKGRLSKSLTSHTGAKAAMKVLEHFVDKKLVSLSDFRKALIEVGKKYNIDFDGRLDAKSIHDDIAKKFFGVNDSTFSKRGFFVEDIINHLAENSKSAKENISKIREMLNTEALPKSTERKTGEIDFAKAGIIDAIGHLLSDNITVGVKPSEAYATIEVKHPVEVFNLNKEEGGHESYPFHLRQIDKNGNKVKPILNVLNEAQHITDVVNDVNNRPVAKKGGAGKFGSNQVGMAKGVVKPASEHPSGVNMMTDATGKIYGFEKNGKIVLNADLMNGNTPFHEAGHLWLSWAKENRSDLHEAGMTKIEGSKYLQDVKNNPVYQENASKLPELERDAYFKSEALAKAIGDNGEQFVNSAKKADFKQWLKDLWTSIADQFGLRDMTAKQISDLTLDEFSKKVVSDIVGKEKGMETEGVMEPAKMEKKYEEIYKDLTNIEKRQIINSKFEKLLEELKIEKICPTD
jgi:hypothetical protein